MEWVCEVCGGSSMLYCDAHDSELCPSCDRWLASLCGDPECPYCPSRPARPSECRHDEEHWDLSE